MHVHLILLVVSLTTGCAGVVCLFIAFFLTEPEEEKAQSTLEQWWIVLDDAGNVFGRRLRNLAQAASHLALRALEAVIGPKTVSLRSFWSFGCFSVAAVISAAVLSALEAEPATKWHSALLIVAFAFMVGAFLPWHRTPLIVQSCGCAMVSVNVAVLILVLLFDTLRTGGWLRTVPVIVGTALGGPAVGLGIPLCLFWAAYLRWTIRQFRAFDSLLRTVVVTVLAAAVLYVTLLVPPILGVKVLAWVPSHREHAISLGLLGFGLVGVRVVAVTAAWPIAAYFISVVLYLALRIAWPVLPRLIYAAQRHRILSNHSLVAKVGIALLVTSGLGPLSLLARFVETYAR